MIVYSDNSETVWNASRLGVYALKEKDSVRVFFLAKVVGCESIDTDKFKVTEQIQMFVENGGEILACGSYLKVKNSEGSEICPLPTMKDLYDLIKESNKVVTF